MPTGRRIAVMAVPQRLDRGLDDVLGRRKSGWPMPRLMMSRPLAAQLGGARKHGEGVFLADAVEGRHGLHDVFPVVRPLISRGL